MLKKLMKAMTGHRKPGGTDILLAMEAHAIDMFAAMEDTFAEAAIPEEREAVRAAFRSGELTPRMDRFPLYLTALSIGLGGELEVPGNTRLAIAQGAIGSVSGVPDDVSHSIVEQAVESWSKIRTRLTEQLAKRPIILDTETALLFETVDRSKRFAAIMRDNPKAKFPLERQDVLSMIETVGTENLNEFPIDDADSALD